MKKRWLPLGTALALTAALTACGAPAQQVTDSALPWETSCISMEGAQTAALSHAAIAAPDADISSTTLEDVHGLLCYKVAFTANGQEYTYSIHAETGAVVEAGHTAQAPAEPTGDTPGEAPAEVTQTAAPAVSTQAAKPATVSAQATASAASTQAAKPATVSVQTIAPAASTQTAKAAAAAQTSAVTVEQAKQAALTHAGVTAGEATFIKAQQDYEDGRLVYEVEFVTGSGSSFTEYDYEIDAATGAVVSYDFDIEGYAPASSSGGSAAAAAVSEETAKQTALSRVPGATSAHLRKFKLDFDDGRWEYEGEIIYNQMEYEFTIDASTGHVVSWEVESVYD